MSIQDDYFDVRTSLKGSDKRTFERFAKWAFTLETIADDQQTHITEVENTIKTLVGLTCPEIKIGYKLVRLRKNGSLGSLFINRKEILPVGHWLLAEPHRTRGFSYRVGFHALERPVAPHLSIKGRVWVRVAVTDYTRHKRPDSQGGWWLLAQKMIILEQINILHA